MLQVAEPPKAVLITSPDARVARPARSFSKHLDYKSCQHILCLTKDMARHLLPPAPQSATHAGGQQACGVWTAISVQLTSFMLWATACFWDLAGLRLGEHPSRTIPCDLADMFIHCNY